MLSEWLLEQGGTLDVMGSTMESVEAVVSIEEATGPEARESGPRGMQWRGADMDKDNEVDGSSDKQRSRKPWLHGTKAHGMEMIQEQSAQPTEVLKSRQQQPAADDRTIVDGKEMSSGTKSGGGPRDAGAEGGNAI